MTSAAAANPAEIEALYPAGSVPEVRIDSVSALCSLGVTPLVMTGMLRQVMLQHFVDPDNIDDSRIRRQLTDAGAWGPGNDSGLMIESISRWVPNMSGQRPAIIIKRNAWRYQRLTIGDQAGEDYRDGSRYYVGLLEGSHTLFALAKQGAEAELLGAEVTRFLLRYSPLFTEQMNLHKFTLVQIDALHKIKEATRIYAVPVTVAYVVEERWRLLPHAPRLKRIRFRASELLD